MKKIVFFCFAIVYATSLLGQKQSIAIYVSGNSDENIKKVIGAKLVSAITKSSEDYAAVERTADFLAKLREEQNYQVSGNVDDQQITRIGRQFGVNFIVVAEVIEVLGSHFVTARMINVETGLVMATADNNTELKTATDLVSMADDVASKLVKSVDICTRKDKHIGDNGCCEGLSEVDGICRDVSGDFYWINTGDLFVKIMNFKPVSYNECNCPSGYRMPTETELRGLFSTTSAFHFLLKTGYAQGIYSEGLWFGSTRYESGEGCDYSNYLPYVFLNGSTHIDFREDKVYVKDYATDCVIFSEYNYTNTKRFFMCVRKK